MGTLLSGGLTSSGRGLYHHIVLLFRFGLRFLLGGFLRRLLSPACLLHRGFIHCTFNVRIARDIHSAVFRGSFDTAVISAVLADDIAGILRLVVQKQQRYQLEIQRIRCPDMDRKEADPCF